ncbi:SDR family NAD(P)-dependent oxidoreductase [Glaciihabitans tibetensis]|nr:SDR family oxidoreductase [Glaciihabitans tibetensis]
MVVAFVTGGTSGIGAAFARQLAGEGYDLVLVARGAERLAEMATELRALGRTVETIEADLADRDAVARLAARLEDPTRPVDLVVNNAGFGMHTSLIDADVSEHDRGFEVMCRAVLVLSGAAARGMLPRGAGNIINVSSTAGFITMGSYSAIKAWVTSFTEGLAVELRGTGIVVTALCPGWVRTEFHERAGIGASSIPNLMWLDAEQLVTACLRDVKRGKMISIPTVRYRALIWMARHAPRSAIRSFSSAISSSRRKATAR